MPKNKPIRGAGPYSFQNETTISPGGKEVLDFRNMKYNKTKNELRRFLPFNYGQVTNLNTSLHITMEWNGQFGQFVASSSSETFDQTGITKAVIKNENDTGDLDPGDVRLEVGVNAYGADEKARESREKPWLSNALNDVIPGGTPW